MRTARIERPRLCSSVFPSAAIHSPNVAAIRLAMAPMRPRPIQLPSTRIPIVAIPKSMTPEKTKKPMTQVPRPLPSTNAADETGAAFIRVHTPRRRSASMSMAELMAIIRMPWIDIPPNVCDRIALRLASASLDAVAAVATISNGCFMPPPCPVTASAFPRVSMVSFMVFQAFFRSGSCSAS